MTSYASSPSPVPLLLETIGANLDQVALRYPDSRAVIDVPSGRTWTYAEFNSYVNDLAAGLIARGIRAGDRVEIGRAHV